MDTTSLRPPEQEPEAAGAGRATSKPIDEDQRLLWRAKTEGAGLCFRIIGSPAGPNRYRFAAWNKEGNGPEKTSKRPSLVWVSDEWVAYVDGKGEPLAAATFDDALTLALDVTKRQRDQSESLPALAKLNGLERIAFKDCEATIERGLKTFYEVGLSLKEIRDQKFYREAYETFEDYCKERWGFSKTHCNRLITAAKVVDSVAPIGAISNEAQARELARLPEDQQAGAWQDIVADAGGAEKVTAKKVKQTVDLWVADNELYVPAIERDADHGNVDDQLGADLPAADPVDDQREDDAAGADADDLGAADDDRILSEPEAKELIDDLLTKAQVKAQAKAHIQHLHEVACEELRIQIREVWLNWPEQSLNRFTDELREIADEYDASDDDQATVMAAELMGCDVETVKAFEGRSNDEEVTQ